MIYVYFFRKLNTRNVQDKFLSRAIGVKLNKDGFLSAIDDKPYVLTLDYTIKMLNIHERKECGMPVILEGETGVGKTALIEMLSELWNQSLVTEWSKQRDRIISSIKKIFNENQVQQVYYICIYSMLDIFTMLFLGTRPHLTLSHSVISWLYCLSSLP